MKTILDSQDRTDVVRRIMSIRPDSVRHWGTMSPGEMVCHLADGFRTVLGDREAADRSTILTRTALRFLALTSPMTWPKGVRTMTEIDQRIGGTPPAALDADLDRLRGDLDAFLARLDPSAMCHPIFGRLSRGEWGRWAYRHLDHHARQFGL